MFCPLQKTKKIIDIFKLRQSDLGDRSFIMRCRNTILKRGSGRCGHDISLFLRGFLENAHSDNPKEYYLGIKNGKSIIGGFSFSAEDSATLMGKNCYNYSFKHDYDFTKDCLIYSMLANAQRLNPKQDILDCKNPPFWSSYDKNMRLSNDKIDIIKKQIADKNSEYTFSLSNDEVNIEKLMGVDDLDYQIMM